MKTQSILVVAATAGTAIVCAALGWWPSWVGAVAALGWPVLLLVLLVRIVTSSYRSPLPDRRASATVDGRAVAKVEVQP